MELSSNTASERDRRTTCVGQAFQPLSSLTFCAFKEKVGLESPTYAARRLRRVHLGLWPVAFIPLAGFRFRLCLFPHVLRQGTTDVIAFLELALRVPPHKPLIRTRVYKFTLVRFSLGHDVAPR